jgi:hypothetical protein
VDKRAYPSKRIRAVLESEWNEVVQSTWEHFRPKLTACASLAGNCTL